MAQTAAGKIKYRQTMIRKHGSEEKWKEFQSSIGKVGGVKGRGHAFAHGKFSPAEAGKIGGARSKRGKKNAS